MPRTRANRRDVATPNGEARTEAAAPILTIDAHPAKRAAQARLEEMAEKLSAAEQRAREFEEQVATARARVQTIRSRHVLGEASDGELAEAQASLADLERDLGAARDWATALHDTVEVLTRRAQDVEAKARQEVDTSSEARYLDLARQIAEEFVALSPLAVEMFAILRARYAQGFGLPGDWALAPLELVHTTDHRFVSNPDLAFAYHAGEATLLTAYLARLAKVGVMVEPPEAISLTELLGRAW